MSNKRLEIPKQIFEYLLLGIKALLAFLTVLFGAIILSYAYFVIDLIATFYKKYQEDSDRDLSIENFEKLKSSSKKFRRNLDQMAKSQQKYERERKIKEDSLKFLNRLIAEGLIREKDLLSFTRASEYFQLFVYSASLNKLANSLAIERPPRQYPLFLEKLGFVRLGKNSTFFLINKNRLENEKLKNIKEMKKFLTYHLSKVRRREWNDFLKRVKEVNRKEFLRLKSKDYKRWKLLKYNFLLTETNMNPTNIGFVDGEYMGLGVVSRNEAINSQILERSKLGRIEIDKQLKVKIRKIIEKLDISLLLDGIAKADRDVVDLRQDIIKKNIGIENVIDFHKVNVIDFVSELVGIGLEKKKSSKIAKQIIKTTQVYKNALTELNITI